MLSRLQEYGLKLSPQKCKFFQTSVKYLGHIVSENGVETDPEKVSALKSWPVPTNLKTLKSFLGFAGYYRRFIKRYSAIAKTVNDLTRGYSSTRKNLKPLDLKVHQFDPKQPFRSRWSLTVNLLSLPWLRNQCTSPGLCWSKAPLYSAYGCKHNCREDKDLWTVYSSQDSSWESRSSHQYSNF